MTSEPGSRIECRAIEERIADHVRECLEEEVGLDLATIVFSARNGFGLAGDDLVTYVRRAITALVAAGATPEHCAPCTPPNVDGLVHVRADEASEVVEAVLVDWVGTGMPDPAWGDFRFNTEDDRTYLAERAQLERRTSQRSAEDRASIEAAIATQQARHAAAMGRLTELGRSPAVEDTTSCLARASTGLGPAAEGTGAGIVFIARPAYDRLLFDLLRGARELPLGPQYPGLHYLRQDGRRFGVRWDLRHGSKIDLFPPWCASGPWVRRIVPIIFDA